MNQTINKIFFNLKSTYLTPLLIISFGLSGCASLSVDLTGKSAPKISTENTTWKAFNRDAHTFNKSADSSVIKPIGQGYKKVVPEFIDIGVSNIFSNLKDVPNALNSLLQLKPKGATSDMGRFVVNSTVGLVGFFDVASQMDLVKHNEDFGQTLAVWGVPSGPYMMLPVLGSSSVRDSVGKVVDTVTNPSFYLNHSVAYYILESIDKRGDLLSVEESLKGISDDDYNALRTAWLQQRRYLINDGKLDQHAKDEKKSLIDELEDLD